MGVLLDNFDVVIVVEDEVPFNNVSKAICCFLGRDEQFLERVAHADANGLVCDLEVVLSGYLRMYLSLNKCGAAKMSLPHNVGKNVAIAQQECRVRTMPRVQ
jgi:hypothetical protein